MVAMLAAYAMLIVNDIETMFLAVRSCRTCAMPSFLLLLPFSLLSLQAFSCGRTLGLRLLAIITIVTRRLLLQLSGDAVMCEIELLHGPLRWHLKRSAWLPRNHAMQLGLPSVNEDLNICTCAYVHKYLTYTIIYIHVRACVHTYIRTYVRTHIHTYIHVDPYVHLYMHARTHARTC